LNSYDADFRDIGPGLVESVWRYRLLVAAVTLIGALSGLGVALLAQPEYQTESRLLMSHPRTTGLYGEMRSGIGDMRDYALSQTEFIRAGPVYPAAAELVNGRYSASEIAERVTLPAPAAGAPMIIIRASDVTPEGAAELADAVAEAYQIVVAEDIQESTNKAIAELEQRNGVLREQLGRIAGAPAVGEGVSPAVAAEQSATVQQISANESRIQQLLVDASLFGSGVGVTQPAAVPSAPTRPRPKRTAAMGLLVGLVASSGFAWWRNSVNQVAAQSGDPAATLQAPLLGGIPAFGKVGVPGQLPAVDAPRSPAAEAYQFVAGSLTFALDEMEGKTVLVTSARPGDGKTVLAANIAVTARRDGREVVIVDADKRVEGLSELLRVDAASRFGFRDGGGVGTLEGQAVSSDWSTTRLELAPDVDIAFAKIGLHADDPASYFRSTTFRKAMSHIREFGDLVVLDTPPLLTVSDTSAIASQVDAIVLVVDRGTRMRDLEEVRRRLDLIGTPLLGYVFNRAHSRLSEYGYRDRYGVRGKKRERTHRAAESREIPARAKSPTSAVFVRSFEDDR
jgi:capsular exopolysaccharide synthesis family protein